MAKMIKCPTCGTQIEVPPAPPGGGAQMIKCPGCGKGLKIVAKKPAGAGPGGSIAGGSVAGTIAGGSVSGISFHGEPAPPPRDDLPALDAPCDVCGRMTPADDLTEDNGRMVCPDCIKGARSKIDRPDEAPELLDYKRPLPAARRGKLIRVTPSLIGLVIAAIVFISCQIYLTLIEAPKGKGRAMASPVWPGHVVPPTQPSGTAPPVIPSETTTTQSAVSTEITNPASTRPAPFNVATIPPAATGPAAVAGATPDAATSAPGNDSIFNETPGTTQAATTPDAGTSPLAVAPDAAPNAAARPAFAPNDPLVKGIEKLNARDYNAAAQILGEEGRRKYRVAGRLPDRLAPEQQMVLVGIAAANIGRGKSDLAFGQLALVLGSPPNSGAAAKPPTGQRTRSAVMNYAIAAMTKKPVTPAEIYHAVTMLAEYLQQGRSDEYAADVFGTLLDRASTYPNSAQFIQPYVRQLDTYVTDLAQSDARHRDQLKWGVEWKDKTLVTQYRAARGHGPITATPEQLQQELEAAKAKVRQLKEAVDSARANGGDVVGAQNQYQAALVAREEVQTRIELAAAPAPKPKWLEKFEPVVPEGMAVTQ